MIPSILQQLTGAPPPHAPPPPAKGATAQAEALVLAGGEWCSGDLVKALGIPKRTAHSILRRMAKKKGLIEEVRTERVAEMRNTNCTRVYYRRKA